MFGLYKHRGWTRCTHACAPWHVHPAGRKSGVTTAGKTDWKQMKRNLIYVDVDTINSKYPVTPRYVTSIHGTKDHWRVQGTHSVYNPESDGFRVYLLYPDVTVADAERKHARDRLRVRNASLALDLPGDRLLY